MILCINLKHMINKNQYLITNQTILAPENNRISSHLMYQYEMLWMLEKSLFALTNVGKNLAWQMRSRFNNDQITFREYNHHLTHAAYASYTSPFEQAACLIVDGEGEYGSVSSYKYQAHKLKRVKQSLGAGSLGALYSMMTKLCGFDWLKGEEWKVMGLSAYGKLDTEAYKLIRDMIEFKTTTINFDHVSN